MKKFLACVFILAIFAGAVFYIGWTQFKVRADSVGVVISKTNGIEKNPVKNGEFSWYWQFLLPTNATIKKFSIKPLNVTKNISGELPSGAIYSTVYSSADNFSYSFDFSISVTVAPEMLPDLIEKNVITDNEDLAAYLNNAADSLAQLAADYILKKSHENPSFRPESIRRDDLLKSIQVYKEFPEIDVSVFAVTSSKIPDYKLYERIQTGYIQNQKLNQNENQNQNGNINSTEVEQPVEAEGEIL